MLLSYDCNTLLHHNNCLPVILEYANVIESGDDDGDVLLNVITFLLLKL